MKIQHNKNCATDHIDAQHDSTRNCYKSVANKSIMPSVVILYVFMPSVVAPSSCTCWWVVEADDPCYVSRSAAVVLKVLALVQVRFGALTVVPVLRQLP